MNNKYLWSLIVFLMLAIFATTAIAESKEGERRSLRKPDGSPTLTKLNINNISTYFRSNGESDINPNGNSGFEYPKGSNKQVFFQSGFMWGGKIDLGGGNLEERVGGSAYRQGLVPGAIVNGVAENPEAEHVRIYRVRRDWETGNVSAEITDGEGTEEEIRQQYQDDWNEWPAQYGAPYEDVNNSGSYEPSEDIPGFPGSDQTIWFVANDLDPATTDFMYGSLPLGIEMQATIWAYNSTGALGNMLFRAYKIINESDATFEDMYVSMWSDPDVGDAQDDYGGSDVDLSLSYIYNGNSSDATYGSTPPAGGFDFFQGPIVETGDPGDEAIFEGEVVPGAVNLPMTAFYFFINSGDPRFSDPPQGEYQGTIEFYRLFRGLIGTTGEAFTDPTNGETTKFPLYGDPLEGTGWLDGDLHPPGDRRIGSASGPFTMEPGDVQEIVVAQIAAGASEGIDRLSAVALLKFYDLEAQTTYNNFFQVAPPPPAPQPKFIPLDREVVIDWGYNREAVEATESSDNLGYEFQGYNVYQLPSSSALISDARRIATFDIIDNVQKIEGLEFDPQGGVVQTRVQQFGTDSGIQRYLRVTGDAFNGGLPLNNGSRYYFAVTSYSYNPDGTPNNKENPLSIFTVVPQSTDPGVTLDGEFGTEVDVTHTGAANASVNVDVVDPEDLTGHEYQVYFTEQVYYRDTDGEWKEQSSSSRLNKDVTGSDFTVEAVYGETPGTVEMNFTVNVVSSTGAWVDGFELDFPDDLTIISAETVDGTGQEIPVAPVINADNNVVTYGAPDRTEFGPFAGGEHFQIVFSEYSRAITVPYVIWDDGYEAGDDGPIDATGNINVAAPAFATRTEYVWNVRDVTTGEVKLQNQLVYQGVHAITGETVGTTATSLVDGLLINVDGSFGVPIHFDDVWVNGVTGNYSTSFISDYAVFAGIVSGYSIDAAITAAYGTRDLDILVQDYELRWTGELEEVDVNGQTVIRVKEGTGSYATFFGSRLYDPADHPLNTTGADRFLVRVPFEVWNAETNTQINFEVYDRLQEDPTADGFYEFNVTNRMYGNFINTPYAEQVIAEGSPDATWAIVFWNVESIETDDVVRIVMNNPIQLGKDTFEFTAPTGLTYSEAQAKNDVEEINVFPNPYYGVNSQELNKYQRFVTFNHLPPQAKIRIFNLAGQLVKTIEKDNNDQFQRWDLTNQGGLPVASGLYIVYIDMPELGTTKILKSAIIQEQQILDRF